MKKVKLEKWKEDHTKEQGEKWILKLIKVLEIYSYTNISIITLDEEVHSNNTFK